MSGLDTDGARAHAETWALAHGRSTSEIMRANISTLTTSERDALFVWVRVLEASWFWAPLGRKASLLADILDPALTVAQASDLLAAAKLEAAP